MQLILASGSYSDLSIDINNQLCVNWFPASSELQGRGVQDADQQPLKILKQTPGTSLLIDNGGLTTRSQVTVRNYTYQVVDNNIYKITITSSTASSVLIGTLTTFTGYVSVAYNPSQIMWVDGTNGYIYNDSTNTFTQISDVDFVAGTHVIFTGSYFIVNRADTGIMAASAINDGLSWNALDVTTASVDNDNIITLAVSNEEIWAIGERSVEIWYNAGNPTGFPFSLRAGLALKIGSQAGFSVANLNDKLFWLDNRGFFVETSNSNLTRDNNTGYKLDIISTTILTEEIKKYIRLDDAVVSTYNDRGHLNVEWSFPTDKKTWVYDTTTRQWHEHNYFNTYTGNQEHSLTQFTSEYNNTTIVSGTRNGKLYTLSDTYLDDAGVLIRRKKTTPFLYNKSDVGRIVVYQLVLKLGLIEIPSTGDYTTPQIGLRYSKDGGHTWSSKLWRSAGSIGEYTKLVTWNSLGTSYQWLFEITLSDPVSLTIIDAWLKVEVEQ